MNNKIISHTLSTFRIIAISSLTIFTLYTVQAWVSPTVSAPNGNVGGPLTTATSTQIKTGSLGLLDSLSIGNNLIINGGFRLTTGAASGTVLTSDANGNASWASSTGSGIGGGSFGPGYAWQSLLGSAVGCQSVARASGVTCINDSGYPIEVSIFGNDLTTGTVWVNGVVAQYGPAANAPFSAAVIVPAGSNYKVTVGSGINTWSELRCDSGVNCGSGPNVPGSLGVGQTWQKFINESAPISPVLRTAGGTYQNLTGKPISVSIVDVTGSTNPSAYFYLNGVIFSRWYSTQGGMFAQQNFIIPNGSSYGVSSGADIRYWAELR